MRPWILPEAKESISTSKVMHCSCHRCLKFCLNLLS
jgi:hypothetical protein